MKSKTLLLTVFWLCLLSAYSVSAFAEMQKFVYVYNHSGELLLPKNASGQCPDPAGGSSAAIVCHGVLVDDNGDYSVRLESKKLSLDNLILISNEYERIPAGTNGNAADVYALVNSKRRIDAIEKDATNNGVNINDISEATVKAVEKVNHVPKGKKGHVIAELAEVIDGIDAATLNHTMGNSQADNSPTGQTAQRVNNYVAAQQERLDENQLDTLVSLAQSALDHHDNPQAQSLIRKNIVQGLVEPATLDEVATRVFSHISALQTTDSSAPLMVLEADKYLVYFDETAELSTANSVNANRFFAYTWQGVQSAVPSATFSKPEKGSYLVCATGEIDNANDSSTDCVRIAVKDQVEAVARANRLRVGTGNSVKLSASLSVGAQSFSWTGSGTFNNAGAEVTEWSAPQIPGTYEITLGINNHEDTDSLIVSVFDVLPVAVAEASPYVVYLRDHTATSTLLSGSISSDGSAVDFIEWSVIEYPQGAQATIADTAANITEFSTNTPGDYTIELLASRRGHTDTARINIQVRDPAKPKANAGDDQITYRNQTILLDGSHSYASEGKALNYLWSTTGATLYAPAQPATRFVTDTLGRYNVTLNVDDGLLSDTDAVNVTVVNRAPAASDDVYANLLNVILYGQLIAMDPDNDSVTYSLVKDPIAGGVTLDPVTGEFVYVPGGVKGCKYHPYTRPQDNDKGGKDVPVIKLCADRYVIGPGETVNLTASNSINASQFSGYEWIGGAIGDPNDIREATYTGTTEGLHQVCVKGNIGQSNNTSTACVDIIVNPNLSPVDEDVASGFVDVFHYVVSDGDKISKPGIIIITIGWENTPAQVTDLAITTQEDTATGGQLQGSDLDGHDITFSIIDSAGIGTVTLDNAVTGVFTYTPNPNANGVDSFTYVAHDGFENSQIGTVTITVESTNDAPVAHFTGILSTPEDNAVTGTLGVTDPDQGDVMDFRLATLPSKGDVIITNTQTGAFLYTPRQDLNGSDSFFFVVHDGEIESNAAKVTITIIPVNDTPVTQDVGPLTTHTDEILSGTLTGSDVDNDALIFNVVSAPTHGSVSLDAVSGDYRYTTSCVTDCTDSFTYSAADAYVSSTPSVVSIVVKPANLPPVCEALDPIDVFEGVPYGGAISCADPDGGSLTYLVVNKGRLGTAVFPDSTSSAYIYSPNPLATGSDYFAVKASDGDKESNPVTVQVEISNVCHGPGNANRDTDGDGYADFVEQVFGTAIDNVNQTPHNLDPQLYPGATFSGDYDNDGFDDIAELWLESEHRNSASLPSQSTLKGVPNCLTPFYDNVPPALFAFSILTPVVDATPGGAKARFALTAVDNAAGITEVNIQLESPSGATLSGQATFTDKPLVAYVEFESDAFSQYAEAGTWTVKTLSVTDSTGNQLYFRTQDLVSRHYATTLEVLNSNPPNAITLGDFQILTPNVDVCGSEVASVQAVATSDYLGIARVAVVLRSPSGENFSWGEINPSTPQTSLTATINTFAYRVFAETGAWEVAELILTDVSGGSLTLDTLALQNSGYSTSIDVYKSQLCPAVDNPTILHNFEVATTHIELVDDNALLGLNIDVSDLDGISELTVDLEGPSSNVISVRQTSPTSPASFAQLVEHIIHAHDLLNYGTCSGNIPWNVKSITIRDGFGNTSHWDEQQLISLEHITDMPDFYIRVPSTKNYTCHSLYAYSDGIQAIEDTVYTGTLPKAYDSLGHALGYVIVSQAKLGLVTITNTSTGQFTYTPQQDKNSDLDGDDRFTYKVNDGSNDSNEATVAVHISPSDDPTEINDLAIVVDQDTTYVGAVQASDADRLALSYQVISNGQKGTATFLTSNTFQYVPNPGESGADEFTIQASDANSTSRLGIVSVSINPKVVGVTGFSFSPVRISSCVATAHIEIEIPHSRTNNEYSQVQLTLQGPSGQVIGFSATPQGSGNIFKLVNEVQTGSLQGGFEPGAWTFKNLLAKRKGETFSQVVLNDFESAGFAATMDVVENCPPAATGATYTIAITETLHATLASSDPEGDAVTYAITTQPGKGRVSSFNAATGEFTFVPSETGVDKFTFVANDGLSDSNVAAEVTINIVYEEPPVAYDAYKTVTKNLAYIGKLEAYDADGDSLVYSVTQTAALGTFTLTDASTGDFEYRPNSGVSGIDTVRFKVNDGDNDSNIATVTLDIRDTLPPIPDDSITVLKNVVYSGQLSLGTANTDGLSYNLVANANRGTVNLNQTTGTYTYTPVKDTLGPDTFVFNVSNGVEVSNNATVQVNIIDTVCVPGGVYNAQDTDGDGYVDFIESALGTDPESALSTPAEIDPQDLGVSFNDDADGDGYSDYIEMWSESNPLDQYAAPDYVMDHCFDPTSDGIKPRLIGFSIDTPTIDISSSDARVIFSMTLLDNASGIKRARVSLLSPSGVFVTASASFTNYPLLTGLRLSTEPLGEFAEQGEWEITGITLFDEAANRLDITTDDLLNAGYATTVEVINLNADTQAPALDDFTILSTDIVYAGTQDKRMSVSLTLSDTSSGVASARVDFISASGTVISASKSLTDYPAATTIQLDSNILSSHLEEGIWTVHNVLLVDAAGNSVQRVDELTARGFVNTLSVTNPNTDSIAPTVESFSVLSQSVYPLSGDAKMSFAVTAYDTAININGNDPSGIKKIRVDITGPAGQILTAWSYFSAPYAATITTQVDSSVLSILTQEGTWKVTSVEVFDDAGNSTLYQQSGLSGFSTMIVVSH